MCQLAQQKGGDNMTEEEMRERLDNANRLISEYAEENETLHGTVKELAESCRDWAAKYADLCKLVVQQHDINERREIPGRAEGSE